MSSDVPDGWAAGQVLDFFQLQRGHDLPVQDRKLGSVPIIASNGVVGFHDQSSLAGPGVITGRSGTIGNVSFVEGAYWPLNTALYVRDFKGADPKFVYYFLQNFPLKDHSTGTGVPTLNRNDVHAVEVVFPPLGEQRQIVEVLRSVDEAIVAQRATVDQHTRLMDAVFEAWSNQLAPMVAIGDLLDLKNGINFEKEERADAGTLTLDVMNMFSPDMTPTYEGAYRISKAVPTDLILRRGDVLFVRSSVKQQGVGWTSLADGFAENTTFCGFIIRGRPKRADVLSRYVVGVLRAPKYRRWLIQHSTRSALTNINQKTIASAEIPLPTIEQQQRLVEQYEQIAHAAFEASAVLAKLERLRVDLANDLLSGRVRMPA